MNQEMELLAFLVTSAANLSREPGEYGALRLIEAASRLSAMLIAQKNQQEEALLHLRNLIEENKTQCMTQPEAFQAMLDEATEALTECF